MTVHVSSDLKDAYQLTFYMVTSLPHEAVEEQNLNDTTYQV